MESLYLKKSFVYKYQHRINSYYPPYDLPDLYIINTTTYNKQVINNFKCGKYIKQQERGFFSLHPQHIGELYPNGYKQKKRKCFQVLGN